MADEKPKWIEEAQAKRVEALRWAELGRVEGLLEAAEIAKADLNAQPGLVKAEMRFDGGASEHAAKRIAAAIRARIPKDVQVHECGAKDISDEPSGDSQ